MNLEEPWTCCYYAEVTMVVHDFLSVDCLVVYGLIRRTKMPQYSTFQIEIPFVVNIITIYLQNHNQHCEPISDLSHSRTRLALFWGSPELVWIDGSVTVGRKRSTTGLEAAKAYVEIERNNVTRYYRLVPFSWFWEVADESQLANGLVETKNSVTSQLI